MVSQTQTTNSYSVNQEKVKTREEKVQKGWPGGRKKKKERKKNADLLQLQAEDQNWLIGKRSGGTPGTQEFFLQSRSCIWLPFRSVDLSLCNRRGHYLRDMNGACGVLRDDVGTQLTSAISWERSQLPPGRHGHRQGCRCKGRLKRRQGILKEATFLPGSRLRK